MYHLQPIVADGMYIACTLHGVAMRIHARGARLGRLLAKGVKVNARDRSSTVRVGLPEW